MMLSQVDKLESNMKQKVDILEKIYESDRRMIDRLGHGSSDLEQYDDYIIEQDSYMQVLDDLDAEYDEIYAYLNAHPDETSRTTRDQKNRILQLVREIDGRIQAVTDVEKRALGLSEAFMKNHKSNIAAFKKTARVITNTYKTMPGVFSSENSSFDVLN